MAEARASHLPEDGALLERAKSLCNAACFGVAMQRERLLTDQSHRMADNFACWWYDLQFLVLALWRLRSAARLACLVPFAETRMSHAIERFDAALPGLKTMRDVGEHAYDYAIDHPKRHNSSIKRGNLQVATMEGRVVQWLGQSLDIEAAVVASTALYGELRSVVTGYLSAQEAEKPGG